MLAKGTSDPYTRFITPEEFESMRKYDVTGVGLHLGTAEEFVRKTGLRLPPGHDESEVSAMTSFVSEPHILRQYNTTMGCCLFVSCACCDEHCDEHCEDRASIVCCTCTGIWLLCTARMYPVCPLRLKQALCPLMPL